MKIGSTCAMSGPSVRPRSAPIEAPLNCSSSIRTIEFRRTSIAAMVSMDALILACTLSHLLRLLSENSRSICAGCVERLLEAEARLLPPAGTSACISSMNNSVDAMFASMNLGLFSTMEMALETVMWLFSDVLLATRSLELVVASMGGSISISGCSGMGSTDSKTSGCSVGAEQIIGELKVMPGSYGCTCHNPGAAACSMRDSATSQALRWSSANERISSLSFDTTRRSSSIWLCVDAMWQ
mmetsp:Transcript_61641/g.144532  ORF Transcript_61641/g.144532 Transcript_61641/m.144532 type:complete len:241 (-) Transcript_61641:54-776(-)